jgi:hypothetical protein
VHLDAEFEQIAHPTLHKEHWLILFVSINWPSGQVVAQLGSCASKWYELAHLAQVEALVLHKLQPILQIEH